MAARFFYIT